MTDKEIVDFFKQRPEMLNDPDYKIMFDRSVKECQPKANRVHDIYLAMIWKCKNLIDFDPHCDLYGASESKFNSAVREWREMKERLIEDFKVKHAEELKETNAIEDGERIKIIDNREYVNELLIVYDNVYDVKDYWV